MPTATDLVTDLPADFEVFGQAVATSMADLLGGTSGQILAKNSNTDMDFVWIANDQGDITAVTAGTGITGGGTSGAVTITNDMATTITASGDIVIGTGSSTYDNLPIGTTGQVLTADTTVSPYKVKWATPAAPGLGKVLQVVNATYSTEFTSSSATFADTGLTASITPTAITSKVLVLVSANGVGKNGVDTAFGGRIVRGATSIFTFEGGAGNDASAGRNIVGGTSASYLDSPATTSATTYKVQGQSTDNAATAYMNWRGYGGSSITLLEIGA